MRTPRLLGEGRSFYHCMSRVVDRRFVFNREEKEFFRTTMRRLEAFHGVKVVTYCLMSNHFHLLLEVPSPSSTDDPSPRLAPKELLRKLPLLYGQREVEEVRQELERAAASGSKTWEREILARYEVRMGDLSVFVKELKQRLTQWYNRRHKRRGTLWEERFKSVLVEGREDALLTMASYIDLNPVRAGLIKDPKDYRWCGYGEAVAGERLAREGLGRIFEAAEETPGREHPGWRRTAARYRRLLFDKGEQCNGDIEGRGKRRGFSPHAVEEERTREGHLSLPQALRCRVRYLCDGAVLGTRGFVDEIFEAHRERFGPNRRNGARAMRGADWGDLHVMRDLRLRVIDDCKAISRTPRRPVESNA